MDRRVLLAGFVALASLLTAEPALAQPGRTPDNLVPAIEKSKDEHTSKSDATRLVGKVLEIDKPRGVVKLQTDTEGVRDVKPNTTLLNAVRVGDMISVLRTPDEAANASPR